MNVKVDNTAPATAGDIAKYALAIIIALAGMAAFYWFSDWPAPLRALLPLAGLVAAAAVFAFSAKGRATREYLSESRFELRKVIWPTREETIKATITILIVVVLVSIRLGFIDFLLGGGVKLLLGH
jgi:preprotein translocase subunit SecE